MQYGNLLSQAWDTVWGHKYLILLGVLAALGGTSGSGTGAASGGFRVNLPPPEQLRIPELPAPGIVPLAIGGFAIIIALLAVVAAIVLWVISTISRGGLIAGVDTIDEGGVSSFGQAWTAGWRKGWRLVGIALLPAIPILLLVGLGLAAFLTLYSVSGTMASPNVGIIAPIVVVWIFILVPLALALGALEALANRACMLENLSVFGSYKRGVEVLFANFGSALVLFLIQIILSIGIGVAGILLGVVLALCCLLWPLLLLAQGAIIAYFSTMWTLAWRQWTGLASAPEVPLPSVR